MGEVLYPKVPPQNSFYALADYDPKFLPEPFFPLKMVSSHWPTSATSPHSGEPPNGLKKLKNGSQWEFGQAFPLMMIKVSLPFIQTKANISNISLASWRSFILKTSHLEHPKLNIKGLNQIQNKPITFYSESNTLVSKIESFFS